MMLEVLVISKMLHYKRGLLIGILIVCLQLCICNADEKSKKEDQQLQQEEESSNGESELHLAAECSTKKCQLPQCRCSTELLPKDDFDGHEQEIPQFVMVTFDDAINTINYEQYQELFDGLVNPDNCASRGTFFVTHEYTDYVKVNALYTQGHEIALHSVTHGDGAEYWRNASVEQIVQEFGDQIKMLEKYAKVDRKNIRGMRLPYLQPSGNNSFVALKELGLLYDSSLPTQQFKNPGMWPYTLDYLSQQDCLIGPCPDAEIPGVWEVPMVAWDDLQGFRCAMIDSCVYQPSDEVDALFDWMLENFNQQYEGNRAPFGMFLHAAWYQRGKNHLPAMRKFLEYLTTLPDVYITTPSRVIQYLRKPTLGKPFKGCLKKPKADCKPKSCSVRKPDTGEIRYMNICDRCPYIYPWLGNPFGKYMSKNRA